jgi:cysteine synthase A
LLDFPEGFNYLIAGVGTGGHITGCAEFLKAHNNALKVIAVEPSDSPVLSGGAPGSHTLQGIGAGFVPQILNREILDGIVSVTKDEAFHFVREAAKQEGILLGISSGANLAAIDKKIREIPCGSKVLTFCYDTGERYLSIDGLFI